MPMAHKISGVIISLLLVGTGTLFAQTGDNFLQGESIFDTPSVDLKVNGSDGPVEVKAGERMVISWISEGATRCRAVWSKDDIKLAGAIAGKLSKSVTVKVACVDEEKNRVDDSVIVKVVGTQPTSVLSPEQSEPARVQEVAQPVRKSTLPQRNVPPASESGTKIPVRNLVLYTDNKPLNLDSSATDREGTLVEIAEDGSELKRWKIKYEHKGNSRKQCDPPVLNISFDKKDSKGRPRELFTGRSTYAGHATLQYQEIRAISECDIWNDYGADNWAEGVGFGGQLNTLLREYLIFDLYRYFKIPTVDVIGFANFRFVSSDSKYNGKTFRYLLFQRDNEQDDQIPFTQQFNLEPTLYEDGVKSPVSPDYDDPETQNRFTRISFRDKNTQKQTARIELDPENTIRLFLLTDFFLETDRATLHNEDYGKDRLTGLWKSIPYGFDASFRCHFAHTLEGSTLFSQIAQLPKEKAASYRAVYYRVAREIFDNSVSLPRMLRAVDNFPFSVNTNLVKEYLQLNFYRYASIFSSRETAQVLEQPFVPFTTNLPFTVEEYNTRLSNFWKACPRKTIAAPDVSVAVIGPTPLQMKKDDFGETAKAVFTLEITTSGEPLKLKKRDAFRFSLANEGGGSLSASTAFPGFNDLYGQYGRPDDIPDSVGPDYLLPARSTVRFFVTIRVYPNSVPIDSYAVSLREVKLSGEYDPVLIPPNETSALSFGYDRLITSLTPKVSENEVVTVSGRGFDSASNMFGGVYYEEKGGASIPSFDAGAVFREGDNLVLRFVPKEKGMRPGKYDLGLIGKDGSVRRFFPLEVTPARVASTTLSVDNSFFIKPKTIIKGTPHQLIGGFYVNVFQDGKRTTVLPVPTVTARTITITIEGAEGDVVRDFTLRTHTGAVLAGPMVSLLKTKIFIVFEGPIVLEDQGTYVLHGMVDSTVADGTDLTTSLVAINVLSPAEVATASLPLVFPPIKVAAPTAPSGSARSQLASPFFTDIRLLLGSLFRR